MSIPIDLEFQCRYCGANIKKQGWRSINTDMPGAAQEIMSGDLFNFTCPKCGKQDHVEYDLLYNDMKHNMWIQVLFKPDQMKDSIRALEKTVSMMGDCQLRVVRNVYQLAEKVTALEFGRDDRIIELIKAMFLKASSNSGAELKGATYYAEDNCEYINMFMDDGLIARADFTDEFYEEYSKKFSAIVDEQPPATHVYDQEWANKVLSRHRDLIPDVNSPKKSKEKASVKTPVIADEKTAVNSSLFCPSCGQNIPSDSVFCPFCGSKVNQPKEDAKAKTAKQSAPISVDATKKETKKNPKKKKTGLVILIIVLVLLAGVAGAYFYSYSTSKNYAAQGDFTKAGQYMLVPEITKLHDPYLYDYIVAGMNYDVGNYELARDSFKSLSTVGYLNSVKMYDESVKAEHQKELKNKYNQAEKYLEDRNSYKDAAKLINELIRENYPGAQQLKGTALTKFHSDLENQYRAKKYAEANKDADSITLLDANYKDTQKYKTLLCARGYRSYISKTQMVKDLLSIYSFKDAKDLLFLNTDLAVAYLKGTWRGNNGMYFTMNDDGSCNYNVPWYDVDGYYFVKDGLYYVAKSENAAARTNIFRFSSVSKDTIDVYAYRTNTTYRLVKQ